MVSATKLFLALAFVAVNLSAARAQESNSSDFISVAAESLCLGALENRTQPRIWIAERASQFGLIQVDRSQQPPPGARYGWRDASDVYVIDHNFGTCAVNVDAQRVGAREAMITALSSHAPTLENLTSRGIAQEGVSDLFCGDRQFGSVYAFIATSESPVGPRLVLMVGLDRQSCADGMRFFPGTSPSP